jgi:uncharacterized protein (TIGR03382 family)
MSSYLKNLVCMTALLAGVLLGSDARAGIIITDGKGAKGTSARESEPQRDAYGAPALRSLSPVEQQIFIWASMVYSGHDAYLECGEECATTDDSQAAGCNGTPTSALLALASALLVIRRRRKA